MITCGRNPASCRHGFAAGSIPAAGTNGQKPEYGEAAARSAADHFTKHMAAGKTAQFPAAASAAKGGMGSALEGLYGVLT